MRNSVSSPSPKLTLEVEWESRCCVGPARQRPAWQGSSNDCTVKGPGSHHTEQPLLQGAPWVVPEFPRTATEPFSFSVISTPCQSRPLTLESHTGGFHRATSAGIAGETGSGRRPWVRVATFSATAPAASLGRSTTGAKKEPHSPSQRRARL